MSEKVESKNIISVALKSTEKAVRNEEKSNYFATKKDEAYTVNNLPMLMKTFEKNANAFLDIVKAQNSNKLLYAHQISKVMNALLNDDRVLAVVKEIIKA